MNSLHDIQRSRGQYPVATTVADVPDRVEVQHYTTHLLFTVQTTQ